MTGSTRVLTSTVGSLRLAVAAGAIVLVIAGLLMVFSVIPVAVVDLVIIAVIAVGVSALLLPIRVSITVSKHGVRYRRPGGRERWVAADSIASAEAVRVGYGAMIGWGIPASAATDRRIVGPGWALHLRLVNREEIWLSTHGPLHVTTVLDLPGPAVDP